MRSTIFYILFIFLVIGLFSLHSSCGKNALSSNTLLDSTYVQDSTAYKYVYSGDKIVEAKRYLLFYDINPVGKVIYLYAGDKIIEKKRYFFPSSNQLTQQLFFYYDASGNLSEIKMEKPTLTIPWRLKLIYSNGNLTTATYSGSFLTDSIIFFYNNDNNIVSAQRNGQFFSYQTSRESNPMKSGNLFLNDYSLSNIEYFNLFDLPFFFNKLKVNSCKDNSGTIFRNYTLLQGQRQVIEKVETYWYSSFTPVLDRRYQFFYK